MVDLDFDVSVHEAFIKTTIEVDLAYSKSLPPLNLPGPSNMHNRHQSFELLVSDQSFVDHTTC